MYQVLLLSIISINVAIQKTASFVGFYLAVLGPALVTTLVTTGSLSTMIFTSPTFWGIMGGFCRWLQGRQKFTDGISSVIVGGISSTALIGVKLPFLDSIIQISPDAAATVNAFLIGFIAMVMLGFVLDFLQDFMKRKKENE